jgi:uncharacterized repeat protein (TIGR01451 family)
MIQASQRVLHQDGVAVFAEKREIPAACASIRGIRRVVAPPPDPCFGGTVDHARVHRPLPIRLATAIAVIAVALVGLVPSALAATGLTVTTPYPAVVVAPGTHVSFNVDVTTTSPERVGLALSGVPDGWTTAIHGGGFVIDAVQTNGTDAASVRVDVTVPTTATGTTRMVLTASAAGETRPLPLEIRVDSAAAGDVTLTTDFPSLRGPASQTFNFNLTLSNQTAEDLTFAVNATGPEGWTVTATLTGQSQAASAVVKAGSTSGVTVSASAPAGVAAGTYPIQVVATAGAQQIPGTLQVEVTGSYAMTLTTPDQRLNGHGEAGQSTDLALTLTNTGTAPVTNVKLTATPPTGWKVTFEPDTVASLDANATQSITAHIVPSGDALAGDYPVTLKAAGDQSTGSSVDIRFTVETSLMWAAFGIGLIVVVVLGLGWVFRRYGRR